MLSNKQQPQQKQKQKQKQPSTVIHLHRRRMRSDRVCFVIPNEVNHINERCLGMNDNHATQTSRLKFSGRSAITSNFRADSLCSRRERGWHPSFPGCAFQVHNNFQSIWFLLLVITELSTVFIPTSALISPMIPRTPNKSTNCFKETRGSIDRNGQGSPTTMYRPLWLDSSINAASGRVSYELQNQLKKWQNQLAIRNVAGTDENSSSPTRIINGGQQLSMLLTTPHTTLGFGSSIFRKDNGEDFASYTRYELPSSSGRKLTTSSLESLIPLLNRREKGVLGFQIADSCEEHSTCHESKKSKHNFNNNNNISDNHHVDNNGLLSKRSHQVRIDSKLHVSRSPSNVNFNAWNWPETFSLDESGNPDIHDRLSSLENYDLNDILWPMQDGSATIMQSVTDDATGPVRDDDDSPTGPTSSTTTKSATTTSIADATSDGRLPWIPSLEQIDLLTVLQLKVELGRRKLPKTGSKSALQKRLKDWTEEQISLTTATTTSVDDETDDDDDDGDNDEDEVNRAYSSVGIDPKKTTTTANSLEEWVRTVDLKPLLERRSIIQREKIQGKSFDSDAARLKNLKHKSSVITSSSPLPEDCRRVLAKTFEQPSSRYSNLEVKQMYAAAKVADQTGDRLLAKKLLMELRHNATPNDARLYRRLARMEQEDGNVETAISILKEGLDLNSNNTYLLHGLGQIYNQFNDYDTARMYYQNAIEADNTFANSYHALGTMEHKLGRIAPSMKVLKKGIENCPTNHRLHHAMGDLYREAKLLDMAAKSYNKVLAIGPEVSHGFAYMGLAYTAYEQDDIPQCRHWLQRACADNNGRHANSWVAWAQLEESEGNIDGARSVCLTGITQYERGLLETSMKIKLRNIPAQRSAHMEDHTLLRSRLRKSTPKYRSGDRFFNVYRTWARLEERYGTIESTDDVYQRACMAFPQNWKLTLDWAQFHEKKGLDDQARVLFAKACRRAAIWNRHADPYRLFAQFEMKRGNYVAAQQIFRSGVSALTTNTVKGPRSKDCLQTPGLTELLYTWAICEWRLENYSKAHVLFKHVLQIVPNTDTIMKSFVLYAIAIMELQREEYHRAQHYISLCLKENNFGTFGAKVWNTWAEVALQMGNERLATNCKKYATQAMLDEEERERKGGTDMLALSISASSSSSRSNSQTTVPRPLESTVQIFRRDPWHTRLFGTHEQQMKASSFFNNCVDLPEGRRIASATATTALTTGITNTHSLSNDAAVAIHEALV